MSASPRRRPALHPFAAALLVLFVGLPALAQQVADTTFAPPIAAPAFAPGAGPVVMVDEGHFNFHTLSGRFAAFARLVERDGFVPRAHAGRCTRASLEPARVLVVSNALAARNEEDWYRPVLSAFDTAEVRAVEEWVRDGGALLLVADHMPFGGAAAELAAAFGVLLTDGFAQDAAGQMNFRLRRAEGSIRGHAITDGRGPDERVDSVAVYTGEAFRTVMPVDTLLRVTPGGTVLLPQVAWEFSPLTPAIRSEGMMIGAALTHGRGRVVVFGEAAMLTAQLAGPDRRPVGMNAPEAAHHSRLVLNTVRWLAGVTGAAEPGRGTRRRVR